MTTDNASSNKKMIAIMVKKLKRDNKRKGTYRASHIF